ncbi:MAG: PQQ-binding-like beta-propeller repeat protein [Thermomicrobiales bacterium]|nr:PQQ-binding-like beta-propeller repeat protein [Thermomicrobiales bacterium]
MAATASGINSDTEFATQPTRHGFLAAILSLILAGIVIGFCVYAVDQIVEATGWAANDDDQDSVFVWSIAGFGALIVLIFGFALQTFWWPVVTSVPLFAVALMFSDSSGSSMEEAFFGWIPRYFSVGGMISAGFSTTGVLIGRWLTSETRYEAAAERWRKRIPVAMFALLGVSLVVALAATQFDSGERETGSTFHMQTCYDSVYGITPANGLLYLGGGYGLIAFDPASKSVRWRFEPHGQPVMHAPTVVDDRIYFGSHDTNVYALDLTGHELWRYDIDNWVFGSPVVANGVVYVGSSAKFVALDAASGTERWQIDLGSWVEISWSEVVEGVIYLGTAHGELIAADAATGAEIWRYQVASMTERGQGTAAPPGSSAWIHDPPIVANGVVYVASADHFIYAVDVVTGIERWRFETSGPAFPSPVVVDGVVYATSNIGYIYALDAVSGSEIWSENLNGGTLSRVVVADGVIFVAYDRANGRLKALDAATGQERWIYSSADIYPFDFKDPVLSDGLILTGAECHGLFAIDAATGTLAWQALEP